MLVNENGVSNETKISIADNVYVDIECRRNQYRRAR